MKAFASYATSALLMSTITQALNLQDEDANHAELLKRFDELEARNDWQDQRIRKLIKERTDAITSDISEMQNDIDSISDGIT